MHRLTLLLLATLLLAGCSESSTDPTPSTTETGTDGASPTATPVPTPAKDLGPMNKTLVHEQVPVALSGTSPREFSVPAAVRLRVTVALNASSEGPYVLYSDRDTLPQPTLVLTQDGQEQARFAFQPAAGTASAPGTLQGPYAVTIEAPAQGGWAIEFAMGASNVRAALLVIADLRA